MTECGPSGCDMSPRDKKKDRILKRMGQFLFHRCSMRVLVTHLTAFDMKAPLKADFDPVVAAMKDGNAAVIYDALAERFNQRVPVVTNKVLLVMHRLITQCNDEFDGLVMLYGSLGVFPPLDFDDSGITSANQNLLLYETYLENLHFLIKTTRSAIPPSARNLKCCLAYFQSVDLEPMLIVLPQLFHVVTLSTKIRMDGKLVQMVGAAKSLMSTLINDAKALLCFGLSIIRRGLYGLEGCNSLQDAKKWTDQLTAYNKCLHAVGEYFHDIARCGLEVPGVPEADQEIGRRLRAILDVLPPDVSVEDLHHSLSDRMVLEGLIPAPAPEEIPSMRDASSYLHRGDSVTSEQLYNKELSLGTAASSQGDSLSGSQGLSNTISDLKVYGHSPFTKITFNSIGDFATIQSEVNSLDTFRGFMKAPAGSNFTMADDVQVSQVESQYTIFLDELLGKGSFGSVYKGWDQDMGRHIACKQINQRLKALDSSDPSQSVAAVSELQTEFNVLKTLNHPNIVNVFDFEVTPTSSRIYMEWMPSGSVQGILARNKKMAGKVTGLREQVVRRYASEALSGLSYMHEKGIIHCDVKPANMLLDGSGILKLSDLGTYKVLDGSTSTSETTVGTVPYLAPECFRGTYSAASDIWALGASVLQMVSGRIPWEELGSKTSIELMIALRNRSAPDHAPSMSGIEMSDALRTFLNRCFEEDPAKRPSAEDLRKDPFITAS